jgi:hypothetical protein
MAIDPANEDATPVKRKISEGRISMRPDISEEEAIQTIVQEGSCPDFVDVANVVQKRFGLKVGSAKVEEVVRGMKQETSGSSRSRVKTADIGLTASIHHDSSSDAKPNAKLETTTSTPAPNQNAVLQFVESMGGFEAAKEAIAAVEHSLRKLMK